MSKEKELDKIIGRFCPVTCMDQDCDICTGRKQKIINWCKKWNETLIEENEELHRRCIKLGLAISHKPTVSRFQIEHIYNDYGFSDSEKMDRLLALLNGEKKWCKHIKWQEYGEGYWLYQEQTSNSAGQYHSVRPFENWDRCPVKGCGAKRP